ncbi:AMIN-like domain-containing (lipo)protein [Pedococcus sp. 2YAF34]|uniref:AMIN-like domain-containing (lipo)protein n=1 Tax=Pedococcus sp. 2YAF34 TaxID=3233032 RepID=UPI003F9D76AE
MHTTHRTTRLTVRSLVVAAALGAIPVTTTLAAPATATTTAATTATTTATSTATTGAVTAPYCGITWGSLAKSNRTMAAGPVTGVRSGRHPCYDRLVVDLKGKPAGYTVKYVTNVYTEGQGKLVPLRGGAKLLVVVNAPAYSPNGSASFTPRNPREVVDVTGYTTFRQVAWAGTFEGYTSMGLGVRARLPFRVFRLDDGTTSRLVIDVAHRW